jgi:3-oxoadipate enol-lactonase
MILLHPLGVDHRIWNFLTHTFRSYSILTYDFPGHGESAVPDEEYDIHFLAEQLASIMAEERIAEAHVVGMSLGGIVAQEFAAGWSEHVRSLTLIDTVATYPEAMQQQWFDRARQARSSGVGSLIDHVLPIWFTPQFLHRNTAEVQYVRSSLEQCSREGYALACQALARANTRSVVPGISAPTLVICGKEDLPAIVAESKWLATHVPQSDLVWLSPGAHASILESSGVFLTSLRNFLER